MDIKELCAFFEKEHQNVKKDDESYIRIMSSNVYGDGCITVKVDWTNEDRTDILSAVYLTFLPDFIGMQEVCEGQMQRFTERLKDVYAPAITPLGRYQNNPTADGRRVTQCFIPIFYNKHKYEQITSHYRLFYVKGMWGFHWALYRSKENPEQKFIHANMHPSSHSERNIPNFTEMRRELVHLRRHYPKVPIFLTGDYNAEYWTDKFKNMFEGLDMVSGVLVAEKNDGLQMFNHSIANMDFYAPNRTTIDHVGVTTDLCDVKLHRVIFDDVSRKATDHCPMFVDVKLK
ncbi:MAG: hypothetical protein J6Q82_03945 [Clostridia bacterium]|nr:hypothetical protein [Clostridia bacterium]